MFLLTFCFLYFLWIVFSGRFDWIHLGLGVVCALFVTYTSKDLLFRDHKMTAIEHIKEAYRFSFYFFWLIGQIIIANFYMLYVVFHPRMQQLLDPQVIELDGSSLKSDFARVVLAQSITLTPGTITVALEQKVLTVYALNKTMAKNLEDMLEQVALVFNRSKRA